MFNLFYVFLLTIVAKWLVLASSQTGLANRMKNLKVSPEGEGFGPIERTLKNRSSLLEPRPVLVAT